MKRTSLSIAGVSTLLIAASLTGATASDMATTALPPTAVSAPVACSGLWDFFVTSCPLSWYGITIYGTVDAGVTWQSHGTPYNGSLPAGAEYLIQKNSNRALWNPANNAVSQSNIGIKGNEEFVPGWAFVFALQANFNPYSLQLSNGPKSVAQNAGVPLTIQSSNGDSSQAGQFYNGLGYLGVSSPYGTLTVFRQNTLRVEGIVDYELMSTSTACSSIVCQ